MNKFLELLVVGEIVLTIGFRELNPYSDGEHYSTKQPEIEIFHYGQWNNAKLAIEASGSFFAGTTHASLGVHNTGMPA